MVPRDDRPHPLARIFPIGQDPADDHCTREGVVPLKEILIFTAPGEADIPHLLGKERPLCLKCRSRLANIMQSAQQPEQITTAASGRPIQPVAHTLGEVMVPDQLTDRCRIKQVCDQQMRTV